MLKLRIIVPDSKCPWGSEKDSREVGVMGGVGRHAVGAGNRGGLKG